MSVRTVAGYRAPQTRFVRRSTGAKIATAAAGTAVSGLMLFAIAYFVAKVIMLPTFIVNIAYLISAVNTPGGMDHFNPTWLIISAVVVILG